MNFEIRQSVFGDLRNALKLDKQAFEQDAWTLLDYISVFNDPSVCRFTAFAEGQFAGFAAAERDEDDHVYLLTLAVCPEFRRDRDRFAAALRECFRCSGSAPVCG